MAQKVPKIFLSYSWKNFDVADQIDNDFKRVGINLIRDVRDAENFKSITDFISRVGKSDFVIMLISKEYLESRFCLYEVIQLLRVNKFERRALPVTIESGNDIYDPLKRTHYYEYWKSKLEEMKTLAGKYQNTDLVAEKERTEYINLYLVDFFKKISDLKTKNVKALKEENYHSLFGKIKYTKAPLLEELMLIDQIESLEDKKLKIDDFLTKHPMYSDAIFLKGLVCSKLNQFTEAKHYYKKVMEMDKKHDWALTNFGALLSNVDRKYDEAISHFETSLIVNPLNETTYQNLGIVYNLKSEHTQAISHFRKAIQINPTNIFATTQIGASYEKLKDYKQAIEHYESAIKLGTKEVSVYRACASLKRNYFKDFSGAVSVLKKALEIDVNNYDVYVALALILQENLAEYENAIEHLQKAILLNSTNAFPYSRIASIYGIELHNYELAKKYFLKAIEVNPIYAQAYSDLGLLHEAYLKDVLSAKWYYERALSIDANNAEANSRYASLLAEHFQQRENAKLHAEKALTLEPESEISNHNYAGLMFEEDPDKALLHFEKALSINPYNKNALLNAGALCMNIKNDYPKASEYFLKLIGLDYGYPNAHFNLAQIYYREEKNKLAKLHYEQEIKSNPGNPGPYVALGALLNNRLDKPEEARSNFKKAIELNPNHFLAHYNLGIVVEKLDGIEAGRIHYRKARDLYNLSIDDEVYLENLNRFLADS